MGHVRPASATKPRARRTAPPNASSSSLTAISLMRGDQTARAKTRAPNLNDDNNTQELSQDTLNEYISGRWTSSFEWLEWKKTFDQVWVIETEQRSDLRD